MEQHVPPHHIREAQFDLLASTEPAPDAMEALKRSRQSRSLLLMKHILGNAADLRPAEELLSQAHDTDTNAVNNLLTYPWVAVWAVTCARDPHHRLHRQAANAVALAAAARAGLRQEKIAVASVAGRIMIPGVGMLAAGSARRLDASDLSGHGWQPIRSVDVESGGRRLTLAIDDLDPYRNCHGVPVATRQTEPEFAKLAETFAEAWSLLVTYAPLRASELSHGLASYVPVSHEVLGKSATCAEAFGGFAASQPHDGLELAITLVHEFQHSKMAALSALFPLCHGDDHAPYFAPWRSDPRPLGGLLQGVYAFTAIASLWRDLSAAPDLHAVALREFAWARAQVRRALGGIGEDAGLTDAGRRLVACLNGVSTGHERFSVPEEVERSATAKLARAEARWMSRHAAGALR